MKTMKIGGTAAALTLLLAGGVAQADHVASCAPALMEEALDQAHRLACESSYSDIGYSPRMGVTPWPSANPLWQKKAGKYKGDTAEDENMRDQLGCDVHESLVTKLYLPRPNDGSPPPRNKKGSNDAQGVANALDSENLKFDSAVAALEDFKASVDLSRPNGDSSNFPALPGNDTPSQADWEAYLTSWADDMIYRVKLCGHIDL